VVELGARSPMHYSSRLAPRLERVNPQIEVTVVDQAGHTLPVEHPGLVAHAL
jgi:pimeloyl-ACP methyl ester carboxylesterase